MPMQRADRDGVFDFFVEHPRAAEPCELSDFIPYLASDRAAAIHGAECVIDGGTVRIV